MDTFFEGPAKSLDHFTARQKARRGALAPELEKRLPEAPITLEIGSGHGHFLTAYASIHSETCVGIDISRDRIYRSGRKQNRAGLENLFFFRCDADDFLVSLPEGILLDRVFVLFPDPWPKRRHHKNRLISENFLSQLADRTSAQGELFFRTDYLPYFEAASEIIAAHPGWEVSRRAWPFESPSVFQNRAEKFWSLAAHRTAGWGREIKNNPSRLSETTESLPPEPIGNR